MVSPAALRQISCAIVAHGPVNFRQLDPVLATAPGWAIGLGWKIPLPEIDLVIDRA